MKHPARMAAMILMAVLLLLIGAVTANLTVISCPGSDVKWVAIVDGWGHRVSLRRFGGLYIGFPRLEGGAVVTRTSGTEEFGYFINSGIAFTSCPPGK